MSLILACDLGGSGLRAALVDERGHVAAKASAPCRRSGDAEADPATWREALWTAAASLLADLSDAAVGAIAIAGFTRTQVLVGQGGEVLRPAILWGDARAVAEAQELKALAPADHAEIASLNAFHPLARLLWLRRHEPGVLAAAAHALEPKDWLNLELTGVAAGDPVSMARLAASRDLLPAAGLDPGLLPRLRPPVSIMGRVRPGLDGVFGRLAGTPVVTMANDTWASVVGLGAMRPGLGYNLTGTTEVLGVVGRRRAEAEGLLTVDWSGGGEGGLWQLGGPSQAGGDTLAWLLDTLGRRGEPGAALDELLSAGRSDEPLLFLPYLSGERTPWWDPSLRGSFIGLSRRHGPADLAAAVLEGIAFLNRTVLERAEAATGERVPEIRFGGGGAANARWRRIKADVMNRTIACVHGEDHGLAGAAIAAWTALGRFPDLAAAQEVLVTVGERVEPEPSAVERYTGLHALFLEAGEALAPLSRRLATGSF